MIYILRLKMMYGMSVCSGFPPPPSLLGTGRYNVRFFTAVTKLWLNYQECMRMLILSAIDIINLQLSQSICFGHAPLCKTFGWKVFSSISQTNSVITALFIVTLTLITLY